MAKESFMSLEGPWVLLIGASIRQRFYELEPKRGLHIGDCSRVVWRPHRKDDWMEILVWVFIIAILHALYRLFGLFTCPLYIIVNL